MTKAEDKTKYEASINTHQCQMQLCFVARLEPTRMRWKDDQVRMTSLETREANVQECNSTLLLSLGWLRAHADCDTHRCWNKILHLGGIPVLRHALTDPLERVCAIKHHDTVVQILASFIVALHNAL